MGIEHVVTFASGAAPSWSSVSELLAGRGFPAQLRMIDGQLAFPDESPADDWRELRVGTALGMVTIRREPERVTVVTWGNADAALLRAWNALAWAFAVTGQGKVVTPAGELSAAAFQAQADLPPGLQLSQLG
jgi:hypothetical protein